MRTHTLSCMHAKTRGCAHVCAHVGARSNASTHGCTRVGAHTCLHTRFFGCTHTHDHTAAPWQVAQGEQSAVHTWPWGWWHLHKHHGTGDLHRSNPGAWGQRVQGEPQPQSPRGCGAATTSPQPRRSWGCLPSPTPQPSPGKAAGCACQFLDIPVKFFPLHLCGNDLLRAPRSSSPVRSHQARSFGEIKS